MPEGRTEQRPVEAVHHLVDCFRTTWNAARLQLYRQHLQVTVTSATPLLGAVCSDMGLDLLPPLSSLRPAPEWPNPPAPPPRRRQRATRSTKSLLFTGDRHCLELRGEDDARGAVLLRLTHRSLELSCQLGDALVRTTPGLLYVRLPHALPEIIGLAADGRLIEDVLDHPWFTGKDWRIVRVYPTVDASWIVVATGIVPYEMPWG